MLYIGTGIRALNWHRVTVDIAGVIGTGQREKAFTLDFHNTALIQQTNTDTITWLKKDYYLSGL